MIRTAALLVLCLCASVASGQACVPMKQPVYSWSKCGVAITDTSRFAPYMGLQQGDRIIMTNGYNRHIRLFKYQATDTLRCPWVRYALERDDNGACTP